MAPNVLLIQLFLQNLRDLRSLKTLEQLTLQKTVSKDSYKKLKLLESGLISKVKRALTSISLVLLMMAF